MNLNKLWKIVKDREAWHATVHGVADGTVTTKPDPSLRDKAHALTTMCLSGFPILCATNRHSVEVHSYFIWRSRAGLDCSFN